MARIKITLPGKFIFSTELSIRVSDINYGGHLGNDSVLSLVHEARIRFLHSLAYSEMDVEGAGLIMTDTGIQYKAEGFLGDKLTVEIAIDDISRMGFDLVYQLTNQHQKTVAMVKTGMLFFDYKTRRPQAVPEAFIKKVQSR